REPLIEEGSAGGTAGTGGAESSGSGSRGDAGCGCRAATRPASRAFGWAAFALAGLAALRRRRGVPFRGTGASRVTPSRGS
ncbi:MAG TPA: MYXO-CTERM sorting domain-containing protein, partial [Polyangiaceae bacterium]